MSITDNPNLKAFFEKLNGDEALQHQVVEELVRSERAKAEALSRIATEAGTPVTPVELLGLSLQSIQSEGEELSDEALAQVNGAGLFTVIGAGLGALSGALGKLGKKLVISTGRNEMEREMLTTAANAGKSSLRIGAENTVVGGTIGHAADRIAINQAGNS